MKSRIIAAVLAIVMLPACAYGSSSSELASTEEIWIDRITTTESVNSPGNKTTIVETINLHSINFHRYINFRSYITPIKFLNFPDAGNYYFSPLYKDGTEAGTLNNGKKQGPGFRTFSNWDVIFCNFNEDVVQKEGYLCKRVRSGSLYSYNVFLCSNVDSYSEAYFPIEGKTVEDGNVEKISEIAKKCEETTDFVRDFSAEPSVETRLEGFIARMKPLLPEIDNVLQQLKQNSIT